MHSVVLCLVWLKLFSILTVTESYGPLFRMIYKMTADMMSFLYAYFSALFIGAVILSCLFFQSNSEYFGSFGRSFRSLFQIGVGEFDLTIFSSYVAFGSAIESFFVVLTNIMLFNILIALLTKTYKQEIKEVDSTYRATLITAYEKWRWDDSYGILILLPSPFTIIITTILPLLFGVEKAKSVTGTSSRIFFILFAIPMFFYFAVFSIIFIPLVYLTSLKDFARGGAMTVKNRQLLKLGTDESDSDEDEDDDPDPTGKYIPKTKKFSKRRAVI